METDPIRNAPFPAAGLFVIANTPSSTTRPPEPDASPTPTVSVPRPSFTSVPTQFVSMQMPPARPSGTVSRAAQSASLKQTPRVAGNTVGSPDVVPANSRCAFCSTSAFVPPVTWRSTCVPGR